MSRAGIIRFVSVVALLNVAALVLLGVRVNANSHRIEVNGYDNCLIRNKNVTRLNDLYAGIIAIERANPFAKTSPETIKARIDLYTAARLDTYNCGPRP